MFSFFKKKTPAPAAPPAPAPAGTVPAAAGPAAPTADPSRGSWLGRLRRGLRKTGASLAQVFTGTQIDDALYEELEAALLMADAGVAATAHLLETLKRRVKETRAQDPQAVRVLLQEILAGLLAGLEHPLGLGEERPSVWMVVGVNGAGKTTTIGKLTWHMASGGAKVLLAAADTFRAAAREQLQAWSERAARDHRLSADQVEIIMQHGADPSAVCFDAVQAGAARGCDVVIADTAGRLPTQLHLMEELKKIKRTLAKAKPQAPHEIILVVDGNTGQNALAQVQAFDAALGLTGLVVTKLDGTAKGGVLAAIALWARQRGTPLPVYFIGVGEALEDLEEFKAGEFAQALLGDDPSATARAA
jgi:fused signal recognition particle receptor